jgi:hypothetical protein
MKLTLTEAEVIGFRLALYRESAGILTGRSMSELIFNHAEIR